MIRSILFVLCVGTMLLAVGCKSDGMSSSSSAMSMPQRGLVATGGNQGTVVFLPGATPGKVQVMSTSGAMVCTKCEADAAKYMETGEITETCSVCGAKRTALTVPMGSTGHQ